MALKKEAFAGLDIRNANNGLPAHYRILYLELRQRPMSREHARPQPPAGKRRAEHRMCDVRCAMCSVQVQGAGAGAGGAGAGAGSRGMEQRAEVEARFSSCQLPLVWGAQ
jgi:hypothetical protein